MLYQVARDYHVAATIESMTIDRIAFWYAGLRAELRAATKSSAKADKSPKRPKRS